jgi:regulatory protein
MKQTAMQTAVRYLSQREHSSQQIRYKLQQKQFDSNDIEQVITTLTAKGYLSDQRFADSLFRHRVTKGYGWRYIAQELHHHGVSQSLIIELQQKCEIDWYKQAELAYNKRFGETPIVDRKDKAKRLRFLQMRGFSTDEIYHAISPFDSTTLSTD